MRKLGKELQIFNTKAKFGLFKIILFTHNVQPVIFALFSWDCAYPYLGWIYWNKKCKFLPKIIVTFVDFQSTNIVDKFTLQTSGILSCYIGKQSIINYWNDDCLIFAIVFLHVQLYRKFGTPGTKERIEDYRNMKNFKKFWI